MNVELATRWLEEGDYNDDTVPRDVDKLIANFIREQATRIAELEEENAAHISLLGTYSDCIVELEEKLRWRDCKTEPPTETGYYLARWNYDRLSEVSGVFFDSNYVRDGWRIPHLTRQPDVWRPI